MSEKITTDVLKTYFSFPFQDERWVGKFAVAAVLVFVGFIPFIPHIMLAGYVALLMIDVVEEDKLALPSWDDLGQIFTHGIRLFGVGFVYWLPAILLFVIGYFSMLLPVITMESELVPHGPGLVSLIGGYILGFGMMGVGGVLSFAMAIFLPAAGVHTVVEREFKAGFRFKEWWAIFRANWDGFLLSTLLVFGGGMLAYYASQILVLTVILCCLYPLVLGALGAYLMLVGGALFAHAYREGREELEAASAE